MATNDELKKGSDLLKDQVTEVGFLDNALDQTFICHSNSSTRFCYTMI